MMRRRIERKEKRERLAQEASLAMAMLSGCGVVTTVEAVEDIPNPYDAAYVQVNDDTCAASDPTLEQRFDMCVSALAN